jgi:hypothetical protein
MNAPHSGNILDGAVLAGFGGNFDGCAGSLTTFIQAVVQGNLETVAVPSAQLRHENLPRRVAHGPLIDASIKEERRRAILEIPLLEQDIVLKMTNIYQWKTG